MKKTKLIAAAFLAAFIIICGIKLPAQAENTSALLNAELRVNTASGPVMEADINYGSKTVTAYVPANRNTFYLGFAFDGDQNIFSASLEYVSAVSSNAGSTILRDVPLTGEKLAFSTTTGTPSPLKNNTYDGAEMTLVLDSDAGIEYWTVKLKRIPVISTLSGSAGENSMKTVKGGTSTFDVTSSITTDGRTVTLLMKEASALKGQGSLVITSGGRTAVYDEEAGGYTLDLTLEETRYTAAQIDVRCPEVPDTGTARYLLNVERVRPDGIQSIILDKTVVNVTADHPEVSVTAELYPSAAAETPWLIWTVEDGSVASVTADPDDPAKAVFTCRGDGVTAFSVTDGYVTAEGVVYSEKTARQDALQNIIVDSTQAEAVLDHETHTGTFYVSESTAHITGARLIYHEAKTVLSAEVTYTDADGVPGTAAVSATGSLSVNALLERNSGRPASVQLTITTDRGTETWDLTVQRYTAITASEGLTVCDGYGVEYPVTKNGYSYTARISGASGTAALQIQPMVSGSKILVNGQEAPNGSFSLPLTGRITEAQFCSVGQDGNYQTVYRLTVYANDTGSLTIVTDPADAVINLTDSEGAHISASSHGVYRIANGTYHYSVTCPGYRGTSGEVLLETGSKVITVALQEAESATYDDLGAEWPAFRADTDNNAVVNSKTPIDSEGIAYKWKSQIGASVYSGSISPCVLAGGYLYGYSGSALVKLDKATGTVVDSAKISGGSSGLVAPCYGTGMIFVPGNGKIQAFRADTLEKVWEYKDEVGGDCQGYLRYDGGYLYAGFGSGGKSNGNWVCIDVTDEDPASSKEIKYPVWTYRSQGSYKWCGCYSNDKYVYVSCNGKTYGIDATVWLYVLDRTTGDLVQKVTLNAAGSCCSAVVFYNGRLYFTTKGGYIHSYNLKADGLVDLENTITPVYLGGNITSTPVIFANRLFVGCAGGAAGLSADAGIRVVDIDAGSGAMSMAYTVPTAGNPQTSGVISTGYYEETGYIYVYFTCNTGDGPVYMVKDKPGLTEAEPESGLFWKPDDPQFCIASLVADSDGTLYYKNDAAVMYAIKSSRPELLSLTAEGGNAVVDDNRPFDRTVSAHTVVVDAGTDYVTLTMSVSNSAGIWMNENRGTVFKVPVREGETVYTVEVIEGTVKTAYTVTVRTRSSDAALQGLTLTETASYEETQLLSPAFAPETDQYSAVMDATTSLLYLWPELPEGASVALYADSGVNGYEKGEEIPAARSFGRVRFTLEPEDVNIRMSVKLTVTAEDGKTTAVYQLVCAARGVVPTLKLKDLPERRENTVTLYVTASEAAELFALLPEEGTVPDSDTVLRDGTAYSAEEGTNIRTFDNIPAEAFHLYMVLQTREHGCSAVLDIEIPDYSAGVVEVSASGDVPELEKGAVAELTLTYGTHTEEELRGGRILLRYDTDQLEPQTVETGEELADCFAGEKTGNGLITVNLLAATDGELPAEGSFTASFRVLTDCADPAASVNCTVELAAGTNENRISGEAQLALAHVHEEKDLEERVTEPTCGEAGVIQRVCKNCGQIVEETVLEPTGLHEMDEGTVTRQADCLCSELITYTCRVCGESYVEEGTAALGHDWDEGTVTLQPGCTMKGVNTLHCTRDGCTATRSESVPATGHTWIVDETTDANGWVVTREATAELEGLKERVCAKCGASESELIERKGTVIKQGKNGALSGKSYAGSTASAADTSARENELSELDEELGELLSRRKELLGAQSVGQDDLDRIAALYLRYLDITEEERGALKNAEAFEEFLKDLGQFLHKDAKTGISAGSENLSWNAAIRVTKLENDEIGEESICAEAGEGSALLALYDIRFVDILTGDPWYPSGSVTVSVPVPEAAGYESVAMVHIYSGGKRVFLDAAYSDGNVVFEADDFSTFGAVGYFGTYREVFLKETANGETAEVVSEEKTETVYADYRIPWLWILIAAGVMALCGALVFRKIKDKT